MRSCLSLAGLALVAMAGASSPGVAQGVPFGPTEGVAPPSQLVMPLVSPAEGERFMAGRVVPPSDVPALPAAAAASVSARQATAAAGTGGGVVGVNALGHELPTDPKGPSGFPRADFAIAPKPPAAGTGGGAAGAATAR
ncbi:hypothetical protein ACFW16_33875 [Inquilinus sp. NPDC058860]|uniref:hypothetical protein n=1 Tax=Inquilinus sp. NPDC058860 TaxID=3346652 RepID=UPI00368F5BDC